MKKNNIKILAVAFIIMIIALFTTNVYASESDAKKTVTNFLTCLENGSSATSQYLDSHNTEIYKIAQDKLHSYDDINFEIKKVKQKGDTYKVEVKIKAEGKNWKVEGVNANFDVQYVNGAYRITDTDFFKITSPEYIAGMAVGIVAIVFLVLGAIFFVIVVVIIIIVVIVVKKNKKK